MAASYGRPPRYPADVVFRGWRGWQRSNELDRRSGFARDGWSRRAWVAIALAVAVVGAWFLKALTIGSSLVEAILSVAWASGIIAVATPGGLAVERWVSKEIDRGPDEQRRARSYALVRAGSGWRDRPLFPSDRGAPPWSSCAFTRSRRSSHL